MPRARRLETPQDVKNTNFSRKITFKICIQHDGAYVRAILLEGYVDKEGSPLHLPPEPTQGDAHGALIDVPSSNFGPY